MRRKQWIILAVVLAVIVAATAGVKVYQRQQDQKAAQKEENEKIYALKFEPDEITGISYEQEGTVLSFTRDGDNWKCDADETADIDADKMKTMLSSLGTMTADSEIKAPEDVSQYGIDQQPAQQVTLQFSDGSEKTLTFGSTNEIVGGTYVQISGDANVYLVSSSYVNTTLNKGIDDLKVDASDSSGSTDSTSDTATDSSSAADASE